MKGLYKLIAFLSLIIFNLSTFAQAGSCFNADTFCSNTPYTFISDSTALGNPIHNYDCLATQPGIHWNQMFVTTPGSMTLSYSTQSSSSSDIDYAIYGPYNTPYQPCSGGILMSESIACSFASGMPNLVIPNLIAGKYYFLVTTNYLENNDTVTIQQTAGTAEACGSSTNCYGYFENLTAICDTAYTDSVIISGDFNCANFPTTGSLKIIISNGDSIILNSPFNTTYNFSLYSPSGGLNTISAYFSDSIQCSSQSTINAPIKCKCDHPNHELATRVVVQPECDDCDATIAVHTTGNSPPFNNSYSFGGGSQISNPIYFPNLCGNMNYNFTMEDSLGCSIDTVISVRNYFLGSNINATVCDSTTNQYEVAISTLVPPNCPDAKILFRQSNGDSLELTQPFPVNYFQHTFYHNSDGTQNVISITYYDSLNQISCIFEDSITAPASCACWAVPNPLSTSVSFNNVCDVACNGSAQVNPSYGTPPYQYQWSNGFNNTTTINNLCVGTYYVTTTDASNCDIIDTVTIESDPVFTTYSLVDAVYGQIGDTAIVCIESLDNNALHLNNIVWSNSSSTSLCDTIFISGDEIVNVRFENSCSVPYQDSISIIVGYQGIKNQTKSQVKAYPNPFSSNFYIEDCENISSVVLYDRSGKKNRIQYKSIGKLIFIDNLNNLSNGIYVMELTYKNQSKKYTQIIKQK